VVVVADPEGVEPGLLGEDCLFEQLVDGVLLAREEVAQQGG
jgi:hypothetical protein